MYNPDEEKPEEEITFEKGFEAMREATCGKEGWEKVSENIFIWQAPEDDEE